jgi:hypothetical protein
MFVGVYAGKKVKKYIRARTALGLRPGGKDG